MWQLLEYDCKITGDQGKKQINQTTSNCFSVHQRIQSIEGKAIYGVGEDICKLYEEYQRTTTSTITKIN